MTAEAYAPDVALIDIELPGMSGFDLCRELRALPVLAQTHCIAQTGWEHDSYRHRANDAGFHHFLVKPVYFDVLSAKLAEIATARPTS
jgi:CheY-like chemotaxis protein